MIPSVPGRRDGQPLNVLCLGAHCDDIEIGAGGTLLNLAQQCPGARVHWMVCCSNEVRRGEAEAAAHLFLEGISDKVVEIHALRDGFLPYIGTQVKELFEDLKGRVAPDLILTHTRNDAHQDHRLVNELTWNTFRSHLIWEYEIPKYDGDLGIPNLFVDLSEDTLARKAQILLDCYASQRNHQWFDEATFRALPRLRGIEANVGSRYAEAFYARKVVADFGDPGAP